MQLSGSQFARPNVGPYQGQPAFVNLNSAPSYANPPIPPPGVWERAREETQHHGEDVYHANGIKNVELPPPSDKSSQVTSKSNGDST